MRPSYHRAHEIACAGARGARARGACDPRARIRLRRTQARVLRPGIVGTPRRDDGVVQRLALQLELFAGSEASRRLRLPGGAAVLRRSRASSRRGGSPGPTGSAGRAASPGSRHAASSPSRRSGRTSHGSRRSTPCDGVSCQRSDLGGASVGSRTDRQHRRRARDAERALRAAEARGHGPQGASRTVVIDHFSFGHGVLGCGRRLAELRASRSGIRGRPGPAARVRDRRRAADGGRRPRAPGTSPTTARCGGSPKR